MLLSVTVAKKLPHSIKAWCGSIGAIDWKEVACRFCLDQIKKIGLKITFYQWLVIDTVEEILWLFDHNFSFELLFISCVIAILIENERLATTYWVKGDNWKFFKNPDGLWLCDDEIAMLATHKIHEKRAKTNEIIWRDSPKRIDLAASLILSKSGTI